MLARLRHQLLYQRPGVEASRIDQLRISPQIIIEAAIERLQAVLDRLPMLLLSHAGRATKKPRGELRGFS